MILTYLPFSGVNTLEGHLIANEKQLQIRLKKKTYTINTIP